MLAGKKVFWRRKTARFLLAIFALSLVALMCWCYEPASPDGVYYDADIACGQGCWILKNHEVFIQCDGEKPQLISTYYQAGNRWLMGNNPTNQILLKPSLWGLQVIGPAFTRGQVFWPRDRFAWTVNLKEWLQSHFIP